MGADGEEEGGRGCGDAEVEARGCGGAGSHGKGRGLGHAAARGSVVERYGAHERLSKRACRPHTAHNDRHAHAPHHCRTHQRRHQHLIRRCSRFKCFNFILFFLVLLVVTVIH